MTQALPMWIHNMPHSCHIHTPSSSNITAPQPLPRPFSLSLRASCCILFPKIKAIQNISIKSELLWVFITCAPVSLEFNYLLILTASNTKNLCVGMCVCIYTFIYMRLVYIYRCIYICIHVHTHPLQGSLYCIIDLTEYVYFRVLTKQQEWHDHANRTAVLCNAQLE